ncbi:hypothetical protein Tco_0637456, partial [Tanacetum coccineum]
QDTQTDCVQDTAQRMKLKILKASTALMTRQTDAEQRRPTIKKLEVKQSQKNNESGRVNGLSTTPEVDDAFVDRISTKSQVGYNGVSKEGRKHSSDLAETHENLDVVGLIVTDKDDTKSQSGYLFVLNGGVVDWKSAKQSVMPSNKRPMEMLCDNVPTISIANDPRIMRGAKHYQMKYHYIREVMQDGEIVLMKVHIDDNLADPFTKPMPYNEHFEHAMSIGVCLANSLM